MSSEETLLAQRVRSRHERALADFISSICDVHAEHDKSSSLILASVKEFLHNTGDERMRLITAQREAIDGFRELLSVASHKFALDSSCSLIEDDIHVAGEDSLYQRQERADAKKKEILMIGHECFRLYSESVKAIDHANEELMKVEQSRIDVIRFRLDVFGSAVAAAAYVNETELQVIVQKATHAINKVLLQNQINIKSTMSSCRQSEILKTREHLAHVADLYNDQLDVIQDSYMLWTVQYLSGPVFNVPNHRGELLLTLSRHNAKIKDEVNQALKGITALAETLTRVRDNATALETCGGTEQNGWLRFYDEDYHRPLFSKDPQTVSTEWGTFLGVIVKNAKCSALELLEAFSAAEQALVDKALKVRDVVNAQLASLYTPSSFEEDIILQCCLSDAFRFPLNTITRRPDRIALAQEEIGMMIDPMIEEVRKRGQLFIGLLGESTSRRCDELSGQLTTSKLSVMSYITEATSELELLSSHILQKIRNFWLMQEECTNDFNDLTARLESSYNTISTSLQRAGTLIDADSLFTSGMAILSQLEEAYHSYHHSCVGPMESFEDEVRSVLESDRLRLWAVLKVINEGGRVIQGVDGQLYNLSNGEWMFSSQRSDPLIEGPPIVAETVVTQKKSKPQPKKSGRDIENTVSASSPVSVVNNGDPQPPFALEFQRVILEVLTPECLLSHRSVVTFQSVVQESMVQWMTILEVRATKAVVTYCKRRREALNHQINELIRRHQRRAPSLQSGIYELRIRELQSSQQNRRRQLESFNNRMGVMLKMIEACLDDSKSLASENIAQLDSVIQDVNDITTKQVLETQGRMFADLLQKMRDTAGARKVTIERQLRMAIDSITSDCESFKATGMKTFDQGGSITEAERRETLNAVGEFQERLSTTEEELLSLIEERIDAEYCMFTDASEKYSVAVDQCIVELSFFANVNSILSDLKGKAYNMILANNNANDQLDKLIANLETAVKERDVTERDQLSFVSCLQLGKDQQSATPQSYDGLDEELSRRLRQTQLDTSLLFHSCRSQRILEAMMELRKPLLHRGAVLDVLRHKIDFFRVNQDVLVDPTEDMIDVVMTAPSPQVTTARKGKPVPNVKEVKVTSPAPLASGRSEHIWVSPEGHMETPADSYKLPSTLLDDMDVFCRDAQRQIDESVGLYTNTHVLLRSDVLGGTTSSQLKISTAERVRVHRKKMEDYVEEGRRKYRDQVQRVFIVASSAADEIFRCLQAVCSKSLSLRLIDVLGSFYTYYNLMSFQREQNNQRLKGCLSAPSNRAALSTLVADEDHRHQSTQRAVKTMWAVALREIQNESRLMALRCLIALQSFFWLLRGLVSPDHLVPGSAASLGDHKGLRRLLRKGERMSQSAQIEFSAVESKTVSPISAAAKTDSKNKKNIPKEIEVSKGEIPSMEFTMCDYEGVEPSKLSVFDQFIAQSGETAKKLVDHYLLPSQWADLPLAVDPIPIDSKKDVKGKKTVPIVAVAPAAEVQSVCAHHRAPSNLVCQSAYQSRERTIEQLRASMHNVANDATKHFAGILLDERQWAHSWNDAISRL